MMDRYTPRSRRYSDVTLSRGRSPPKTAASEVLSSPEQQVVASPEICQAGHDPLDINAPSLANDPLANGTYRSVDSSSGSIDTPGHERSDPRMSSGELCGLSTR